MWMFAGIVAEVGAVVMAGLAFAYGCMPLLIFPLFFAWYGYVILSDEKDKRNKEQIEQKQRQKYEDARFYIACFQARVPDMDSTADRERVHDDLYSWGIWTTIRAFGKILKRAKPRRLK